MVKEDIMVIRTKDSEQIITSLSQNLSISNRSDLGIFNAGNSSKPSHAFMSNVQPQQFMQPQPFYYYPYMQ